MILGDNSWYKIYIIKDNEPLYLYYRLPRGFYWDFGVFATLFLKQHTLYDEKLINFLKGYNYCLEKCEEFYPHHSYMKYHGKIY